MDGMDMHNGSMGGMHMTFYFGNDATILFAPWKVTTWQGMLWSCIIVLVVSFAYEGLKTFRQRLLKVAKAQRSEDSTNSEETNEDNVMFLSPTRWRQNRCRVVLHLIQTSLHLIQITVGYMLMLVAMTFNAWLFISLVLGASLGYLLFNFRDVFSEELHDPCH